MKKLTIGILIIIPILIVLVVSLVSVIISRQAYIGVEEIVLSTKYVEIPLDDCVYDLDDFIEVEILPERATNRSYIWEIDFDLDSNTYDAAYLEEYKKYEEYVNSDNKSELDPVDPVNPPVMLIDDNGKKTDINTTGKFVVNTYCSFRAIVQAENESASCIVYVMGYEVKKVDISLTKNELAVGDKALIDIIYTPIDSIVEEKIWVVQDDSIATVDENGVVTALKEGKTSVLLKAKAYGKDEYIESAPIEINVTKGATKYGNSIKTTSNSVELSALGIQAGDVSEPENCAINGANINIGDVNLPAYFCVGGKKVKLQVVQPNEIEIENAGILEYDEMKDDNFILSAEDKLYLKAMLSDSFAQNKYPNGILWSSNVPAVATVDMNGVVSGIKSGIATITATDQTTGQSASIILRIEKKVGVLLLGTTTKSLEVGLAKQTVFASKEYADKNNPSKDNLVNNTFEIEFARPVIEDDEMYDAFNFEVLENGEISNKAHFENNVLVFDKENITELTVLTVKISAKYPRYQAYQQSATGYINLYVANAIGVHNFKELKKACEDGFEVCLENDIELFDGAETTINSAAVRTQKNIYGNNHMYSAKKQQNSGQMILVNASNVTISNIILRTNEVGKEITTADDSEGLKGYCIWFDPEGDNAYYKRLENCRVEYSILENTKTCIRSVSADLEIEGCILRNTQGAGVHVPSRRLEDSPEHAVYSHITIKNCIMSNLIGMGFSFEYAGFSDTDAKRAFVEEDIKNGINRNTTLKQEGFLDIYNWQETSVMSLIDENTIPDDLVPLLGGLQATLSFLVERESFAKYRSDYNGQKYVHLGMLSSGFSEKSYLEVEFEDKRFVEITTEDFDLGASLGEPIRIFTYGSNDQPISPVSTYTYYQQDENNKNTKLIEKLHGNY